MFGRSFNDIGTSIVGRINDIKESFQATKDILGSIKDSDSVWKRLYQNKESIQSKLINVDALYPEIDKNNFDFDTWIDELNNIDKKVKEGVMSWQDYSDGLQDNQKWIAKWGQETEGQIRTEEGLIKANKAARESAIAHNNALKQQTLGAKAATVATKAFSVALNMIAFFAITEAISAVVTGLHN